MMVGFLVLAITLGSLLAAGLPLLTAIIGVGIGLVGLQALTDVIEVSETAPILATMLGLAVGIDYALFILTRYRSNLKDGMDGREAAAHATATAGSAVVFAGATVVIALVGLLVVNIPFLTVMGMAAAGTVSIAVLIALTLLPAIFWFAGPRLTRGNRFVTGGRGVVPRARHDEHPLREARDAPAVGRRAGVRRPARGDRRPGHPHGARPAGRGLGPGGHHHAAGLRPARGGLRPRLQRPAHRRRRRAEPARPRAGARGGRRHRGPEGVRRRGLRLGADAERGRRPHGRLGHPDQRPDHAGDARPGHCPARQGRRGQRGERHRRLRHRPDRHQHRHRRPAELVAPAVRPGRRRPRPDPADDRLPLDPRPDQGRRRLPAQHRRVARPGGVDLPGRQPRRRVRRRPDRPDPVASCRSC